MAEEMIIDLTNYKDRIGARVKPGTYDIVVEDAESDTSNAGNPMINLWYRINGGDFDGATIVDRLTLTEKALFRVVNFMQAAGFPTPKKRFKIDIQKFVGRKLTIEVDDGEPYNGRIKSEVRGYMRQGSSGGDSGAAEEELLGGPGSEETETGGDTQPADKAADPVSVPVEPETIDLDSIDLG